jgi:hypothetical protein
MLMESRILVSIFHEIEFFGSSTTTKTENFALCSVRKTIFCSKTHKFHTFLYSFWEEKQVSIDVMESKNGKVKYKYFTFCCENEKK